MNRLKEVMLLLIADDQPLGAEWLDHPLKGDWSSHRECHVGGDFLLIYKLMIPGSRLKSLLSGRARMRICLMNNAGR